jgi:hypothetical protein
LVDIIGLSYGALSAEVVDEVESRLADTATGDPIFIDVADGSADAVAALTCHLVVSINAVAALKFLVVDLGA